MASDSSFMDWMMETQEEEVARLAQAPAGSTNHGLSQLPVNITSGLEGTVIKLAKLPHADGTLPEHTMIVVPVKHTDSSWDECDARQVEGEKPFRLHDGSWACIVVASNHPSYPVGSHRLSIPEVELVRGTSMESVFEQELTGQKVLSPEAEAQTRAVEDSSLGAARDSIANLVSARDGEAARAIADGAMVQMTSDEGASYQLPLRTLIHELFQDAARLEAERVSRQTGFEAEPARFDTPGVLQGGAIEGFDTHPANPQTADLQQPHPQAAEVWKKFPELNPANRPRNDREDSTDFDFQR